MPRIIPTTWNALIIQVSPVWMPMGCGSSANCVFSDVPPVSTGKGGAAGAQGGAAGAGGMNQGGNSSGGSDTK